MIVTSVQIKTAKTQKHLYCLVFIVLSSHIAADVVSFAAIFYSHIPCATGANSI